MPPKQKLPLLQSKTPQFDALTLAMSDDDDDFQNPSHAISLTQNLILSSLEKSSNKTSSQPQKTPVVVRSSKKPKRSIRAGKENIRTTTVLDLKRTSESENCNISTVHLISMEPSKDCSSRVEKVCSGDCISAESNGENAADRYQSEVGSLSNMVESSLVESSTKDILSGVNNCCYDEHGLDDSFCFSAGSDETRGDNSIKDYFLASIESPLFEANENCSSSAKCGKKKGFEMEKGYLSNSIESRLLASKTGYNSSVFDNHLDDISITDFEPGTQLNVLMELCTEVCEEANSNGIEFQEENDFDDGLVKCPLCGIDISDLSEELRLVHSNECLDRDEIQKVVPPSADSKPGSSGQVGHASPVLEWLRSLGLSKYEEAFVKEEIDWETLQWLTEEDLFSIGITALGPRKKIAHALNELRKGNKHADDTQPEASKISSDETNKLPGNKLITEYFPGSFVVDRNRSCPPSKAQCTVERSNKGSRRTRVTLRNHVRNTKVRDMPSWCCVPGTPFRVDAFRYLRGDCSHWFLTHFHIDHYQGLTKSFCHGKIYCSSITARLLNMKIGVPCDRLQVLPLNQKISISGVDVTCLDANHCPGSVIILFEPPNGKAVLHTGDFRFSEDMENISILQSCPVQTLILDTTYCNPQYDFPKQEAVIQFVIEAIQAEAFNPKTLFLIGSYTIGKERLFLEVARCLRKKVYVGAAKLHLLECLGLPEEDMQWFTLNEQESHIHVVPMWTIASFKRMKHISNQYSNRFNLIVAFSPTGWTFGKGKKKSPGRRLKQGTIIRYEVPYSEHSSFTELREFVKFISPENIIPSVNNDGPESADAMIALLIS